MHVYVLTPPTAFHMLEPTLSQAERPMWLSPCTGTLAIVPLRTDITRDELELACDMHAALSRGLLVVV
jgi:hypothetical protein